ncbi:hypothetical protein HMPREF1531_00734 [Propionibacterium sp. oral taxon 192 str. F0372]|uniref:1-propanol dehydrogenase PduQ n=1 Tax=Propionibacterium sp. oral taxon 192 TaxID=671222 RepID=UPI000353DB42|nr:1-propanol dehydrogenase PduQ [Propionibacterium sp. oral taxon 192]EPH06086.1 hypothetical protein HMPREF1531_00734 [Propionibacterium sp. oral taxon 192 str. F0372]
MENFHLNTRVRMGADALTALDEYRDKRALIVTDSFLATTEHFAQVRAHLGEVVVFDKVLPNPTTSLVAEGTQLAVVCEPFVIIAYGGGSAMDTAKAIHMITTEHGMAAPGGLIAIPTTSGSGSEVTSYAVITDDATHAKTALVSPDLVAKLAILDPTAVAGCPPRTTADSGMDVLTHAVEAHVSSGACDFSDALSEKAVRLVFENLERCYRNGGDLAARTHMHNASTLAAAAFDNVGLGIVHSISHAVGSHYPVAHGRLNAILLPHVISFNAEHSEHAAARYAQLGRIVSPSSTGRAAISTLIARIEKLNRALDIPARLTEAGVDRDVVRIASEITGAALADTCTRTNPAKVDASDLERIMIAAL